MKNRILFVDDDHSMLMGMRRMLRNMRGEWDMEFVETGAQALNILAEKEFDVIVSDMRMPGMDGCELLDRVRKLHPHIIRIIFSGHCDQQLILRSARNSHRFLAKPCRPENLIALIRRSCDLRDRLSAAPLHRLVSRMEVIPSLPSLYQKLLDEVASPEGSVRNAGRIIAEDPGMSAKILQLINSSFFGLPRSIATPAEAVALLGFNTVKDLVLSVKLFTQFEAGTVALLDLEALGCHCMRTGCLAGSIASLEGLSREFMENATTAGLLHDLGKLILASNFPEEYRNVLKRSREENLPIQEAEKLEFGAAHPEVGAYLLGLWGLPDTIVSAVALHHSPWECMLDGFQPVTAVAAADILDHAHGTGSGREKNRADFMEHDLRNRLHIPGKLEEWAKLQHSQ